MTFRLPSFPIFLRYAPKGSTLLILLTIACSREPRNEGAGDTNADPATETEADTPGLLFPTPDTLTEMPPDTTGATPPPIPAADLALNPGLEALIRETSRRDTFNLLIKRPKPDEVFPVGVPVALELNAATKPGKTGVGMPPMRILLFSNKPADYQQHAPLAAEVIKASAGKGNTTQLNAKRTVALRPGLYYYVIEDELNGSAYYAGRFWVK
jgi:hypothetical protein